MYATTAKFKSANFFISAARDQTAKFKDRQYFQLYGMPDTNDHHQRGIYSVAIILGQQHYRREIWATFLHIVLVVWVMYSIYNQRTTSPLKIQCRPRCYAKLPTAQAIPVSSAVLGWPGDGDVFVLYIHVLVYCDLLRSYITSWQLSKLLILPTLLWISFRTWWILTRIGEHTVTTLVEVSCWNVRVHPGMLTYMCCDTKAVYV